MTKLTTLKPSLSTLPNALVPSAPAYASEGERQRYRDATQPWRKWYRSKRWAVLRWRVLVRDHFTCQWQGCGKLEGNTKLLVAHHRQTHHGNATLFWDDRNLMTVCKDCHDGPIQALERAGV